VSRRFSLFGGNTLNVPSEYATLAAALAAAQDGDEIVLAAGTHTITGTQTLGTGVTVRGATDRPAETVILAGSQSSSITMLTLNAAGAKVCNLTIDANPDRSKTGYSRQPLTFGANGGSVSNCVIRNAFASNTTQNYANIQMTAAATLTHCVSSNCWSKSTRTDWCYSAVINCLGRLSNCLIVGNRADLGGMGIVRLDGTGRMENCTLVDNNAYSSTALHILINGANARVVNCAVGANVLAGSPGLKVTAGNTLYTNCVSDVTALGADGVVSTAAEMFADPYYAEWAPRAGGPLVDKGAAFEGAPAKDLAGAARVSGDGIDIGAYELDANTFAATFSADLTEAPLPARITFTASVSGCDPSTTLYYDWDFDGDGTTDKTTTSPVCANDFTTAGCLTVVLTVRREAGNSPISVIKRNYLRLRPSTLHVVQGNPKAAEPYDTVANAAADIQTAIDFAVEGCAVQVDDAEYTMSVTAPITLAKGVTLKGSTGRPEGTTLVTETRTAETSFTMLTIDAVGAKVCNLTLDANANSATTGYWQPVTFGSTGGCVSNCVIRNALANKAGLQGYASVWMTAAATVTHCVISNCWAKEARADSYICAIANCPGRLSNCLIAGNRAEWGKMAIVRLASSGRMENCTLADNNAYGSATKHILIDGTDARVVNCAVGANVFVGVSGVAATAGNALYANCVSDGTMALGADGVVSTAAEMFGNALIGDWTPKSKGPLVDKCASGGSYPATDVTGGPRLIGAAVDIGAIELDSTKFSVGFSTDVSAAPVPADVTFSASTTGCDDGDDVRYYWDLNGDGKTDEVTTQSSLGYRYETFGTYDVTLTVTNSTKDVSASKTIGGCLRLLPATLHVVKGNPNAAEPYDTVANAAADIQTAIDFAVEGCTVQVDDAEYTMSVTAPITLAKGVTLKGLTDRPEGTTLITETRTAETTFTMLTVDAAGAKVCDLTLDANANTATTGYWQPVTFGNAGGCISNCVIRNAFLNQFIQNHKSISMTAAATITHCVISNCWAKNARTDSYVCAIVNCPGRLSNCLIAGNRVDKGGISIVHLSGSGRMENCTFVDNNAYASSAWHISIDGSTARVVNCAVGANVLAGVSGVAATAGDTLYAHCLSDAVKLGADGLVATAAEIFNNPRKPWHPAIGSPAVNVLLPEEAGNQPAVDLDGRPRRSGRKYDLGCYECPAGGFTLIVR